MVKTDGAAGQHFHFIQGRLKQLLQGVILCKLQQAQSTKIDVLGSLALGDVARYT